MALRIACNASKAEKRCKEFVSNKCKLGKTELTCEYIDVCIVLGLKRADGTIKSVGALNFNYETAKRRKRR